MLRTPGIYAGAFSRIWSPGVPRLGSLDETGPAPGAANLLGKQEFLDPLTQVETPTPDLA